MANSVEAGCLRHCGRHSGHAGAEDEEQDVQQLRAARPDPPATGLFFATCLVDVMAPGAGMDAIALIRAAGIEVDFPEAQSCCGQPAYSSGFTDEARRVARAQLALFSQPWPIVVPSGSCAGMMVHHWPHLFVDDPALAEAARAVARRVVELSAFARDVLGLAEPAAAAGAPTVNVALHTSCSARR